VGGSDGKKPRVGARRGREGVPRLARVWTSAAHIYIYIYVCVCVCVYIYIYIYIDSISRSCINSNKNLEQSRTTSFLYYYVLWKMYRSYVVTLTGSHIIFRLLVVIMEHMWSTTFNLQAYWGLTTESWGPSPSTHEY
jgi:hypothetical protein